MPTQTVTPTRPIVKLSDRDTVAGIGKNDRLCVQYRATLVATFDLDDAIRMAQMVLRYAERNGINVQAAAADIDAMPQDWQDDEDGDGFAPRF